MQRRHFRGLFAAVAILIAYGSLFPFHFHAAPHYERFLARPHGLGGLGDVVLNLFLYTPFAFLLFHSLAGGTRARRAFIAAGAALAMSVAMELTQGFDYPRDSSFSDILCNGAGAIAGALFASAWHRGMLPGSRYAPRQGAIRPAFLLLFWALFQLYPLIPYVHLPPIEQNVATLVHRWSAFEGLLFAADWLMALLILREILPRDISVAAPLAICLAAVKLVLLERALTLSEVAGALAAVGAYYLCVARPEAVWRVMPWALVLLVVVRELWPFHFGEGGTFVWVPFTASLEAEASGALVVLARKAFVYGSVIWAFSKSGRRAWAATFFLAVVVFGLEWAQQLMPDRTPEITDAVVVVLIGATLEFLPGRKRTPAGLTGARAER